ncbi:MAG: hypothetical protein JNK79_14090, partial [Chitinophagaceae bacterium]|nr:hypothetical protein [Chitinophagaceae bacterium]
ALVQIVACTKTVDTTTNNSITKETSSDAVVSEFDNCKLRNIIHHYGGDPFSSLVNGLFTYNKGNPISLTYGNQTGTGNPNHYFLYDKQNRLREYRIGYSIDDPVEAEWHKYGYNDKGQISVDSIVSAPLFGEDGQPLPGDTIVITLTYDDQNRIIKESIRNIKGGPIRNPTYTYDSRGNLAVKGWKSSSYDNKVSIFRSHPVFQFIHRNYSKNNAAPQAKYNSKGLPLSMNPANDAFFNAYPTLSGGSGITKVMYDCL